MNRQERKRWERDRWPRWEQLIRFKVIKKQRPHLWQPHAQNLCSEPRTAEERQEFIDIMLADLERIGL